MRIIFHAVALSFLLIASTIACAAATELLPDPLSNLAPGSTFTVNFPQLPPTFYAVFQKTNVEARMTVFLPSNYEPSRTFPLLIFLNGWDGGPGGNPGVARSLCQGRDFICVSMPLFKANDFKVDKPNVPGAGFIMRAEDGQYMWPFFKTMLEKLEQMVTNIDPAHRILGGFSNGAHATAALIDGSDGEVARRFSAFLFVEGGGRLQHYDLLRGKPFLMVSSNAKSQPRAQEICDAAKAAGAKATLLVEDVGKHDFPKSAYPAVGQWLREAALGSPVTARELIRDPHFQRGFHLLEPEPGKRVVYGELSGLTPGAPIWDLAQWSSRFPLAATNWLPTSQGATCGNNAKKIVVGKSGSADADLSLAVNAGVEYPHARKSTSEPWVHLLVQQEFSDPPALAPLSALRVHLEARLKRSRLVSTNDYSPSIHAAQFFVYLTVANRNPKAAGYQECFWFGIPIYDNRERFVSAYEARDFGGTSLFIFTPASDTFARQSTHDGDWVAFDEDLLPLMRQGLVHAHAKGFIKGSTDLADYRPLGIFIGWEVPGRFDADLQTRNLSLRTIGP